MSPGHNDLIANNCLVFDLVGTLKMSKQPNVTVEHSLGKSAAVKRKQGRPKKQTEASLSRSEGEILTLQELTKRRLSDMCDDLGRLGKVLT